MSEKAVWFGHFWENLSYGNNAVFQNEVLDFVTKGGKQNLDVQVSLRNHADDFKDQSGASAWIIYPEAYEIDNGDGTFTPADYKDMNIKLQDLVKQLTGITATMTTYNLDDAEDKKALSRALYQYDPEARTTTPKRGSRFIHEYKDEGIRYF